MPWVVTIASANNVPLGDRDAVKKLISDSVPGMTWIEEPPMLERIKDMPTHPLHALLPTWPEETRASFARSKLLGDFDAGDFLIQLYGFEAQPIMAFSAEVRGDGNPLPLLASVCVPNGWVALDHNNGSQPIDFSAAVPAGWERFRKYRDSVTGAANRAIDTGDQTATRE